MSVKGRFKRNAVSWSKRQKITGNGFLRQHHLSGMSVKHMFFWGELTRGFKARILEEKEMPKRIAEELAYYESDSEIPPFFFLEPKPTEEDFDAEYWRDIQQELAEMAYERHLDDLEEEARLDNLYDLLEDYDDADHSFWEDVA